MKKQFLFYSAIAVFAIFIGSQITEGALLVPYWQSMAPEAFYEYYNLFGPSIGQFYTLLTIIAALIPIVLAVYCKWIKSDAFPTALGAALFAVLFVSCFYIYFKGANEQFYNAAFSEADLKTALVTWSYWHWGRIVLEVISLVFLMVSFSKLKDQ